MTGYFHGLSLVSASCVKDSGTIVSCVHVYDVNMLMPMLGLAYSIYVCNWLY